MRISVKIWLLAILYQTIIFAIMPDGFDGIAIIVIPIEFIGGLPGLFIFDLIMKYLKSVNIKLGEKWICLTAFAIISSFATTFITALFFGDLVNEFFSGNNLILFYAPIAAMLSLFKLALPANKFLKENLIQL